MKTTIRSVIQHIEMDDMLEYRDISHSGKACKNKHRSRPYWSDTLATLWRDSRLAEKDYLKSRSRDQQRLLRDTYKTKRRIFYRMLRKQERAYHRSIRDTIDTSNPTEFWNYVKRLGPRKQQTVSDTVTLDDGSESSDKTVILDKWKRDFESLFNGNEDAMDFDDVFLERAETFCREWDTVLPEEDNFEEMEFGLTY